MKQIHMLLFLSLLITLGVPLAPCPLQYEQGSLISARILVGKQQSLVTLLEATETQCYNYSLPYSFTSPPSIAIAVHDFESRVSNDLFFSIKNVDSESLAFVPFLIRTHWKYTSWTQIGFSFIAEDRKDVETGYYQIDSGSLGGCEMGKDIKVLLPFRQIGLTAGQIKHSLFLHGFQISSQKYNETSFSPFEVQIAASVANYSGIAVLISVTSITQVHALHISYFAWTSTNLSIVTGNYVYEMDSSFQIAHTPMSQIGRNYARLHGITGFIIKNNFQSISLDTTWDGNRFSFDLGPSLTMTQYFSFQYVFFIGSECSDCPGYPLTFKGKCVSSCPSGSSMTHEKTCIECGDGYYWDGLKCLKLCPQGQYLNIATNECECPAGRHWNGVFCINCNSGRVFNPETKTCKCPEGTRWNGYGCVTITDCLNGKEYDAFSFTCKCPTGTIWNGTYCFRPPLCRGGKIINNKYECVCPPQTFFMDGYCQTLNCNGGRIWNGTDCACPDGYNWNGTYCLVCINGQIWDSRTKSCICQPGFAWNGNYCAEQIVCSNNRTYSEKYKQCLCPDENFWNGAQCMKKPNCCCGRFWDSIKFTCSCPEGFSWDGKSCILCTAGKVWDQSSNLCVCPPGTQWNNQFCTVIDTCYGGMMWNQNTWSCECSSFTVWNGNFCIANPCVNGQVWDQQQKLCRCVGNLIKINGRCAQPEINCRKDKTWNQTTLRCDCPDGYWDNGTICEIIRVCVNNQIYNFLNNRCVCEIGLVWLESKQVCGDPTCPQDQRWDGNGCVDISCPPNSYYNGSLCICPDPADLCQPWEIHNGKQCVYFPDTCPQGTRWDGKTCISVGQCPEGFYSDGNSCKPFPQRCIPPTVWENGRCVVKSSCPYGTFKSGSSCQPYTQCQNGQMWNSNLIQCVCPEGTGWSGSQCVTCGGGQIWDLFQGCMCPEGFFLNGEKCEEPGNVLCGNIPNAYWDTSRNKCFCHPGFTVVGFQCICKGVPYEHFCDRCAHRPNSEWKFAMCQCNTGYTLYGTQCLPNQRNGNDTAADCNTGTFFDSQQQKCLSCSDGCISCEDSYNCVRCSPDFVYNDASRLCSEKCGDGVRYVVECDDGNVASGDGCDTSCRIEPGYFCTGGSPNSNDTCFVYTPDRVSFVQTGIIRYSTKIVINLKIDYLPRELIQSSDCQDRCSQVLVTQLSGETAARIRSNYISGSRYAFSVEIEFDRPYIAKFTASISINPTLARFFTGININTRLNVEVNPVFLAQATRKDILQ